ncbi:MAG: type II secretion system protein GspM [Syntrophus sp. (in: bacteria)]|nr:type II secretion system protein GspM [Syntrophus sp. (in: bacteria)]
MPFKNLLSYWSGLRKRERYVAGAGLAGVLLLLFCFLVLMPVLEARDKLSRSIKRQENVLQKLISLDEQYRRLKGSKAPSYGTGRGVSDFAMSSRLDSILREADLKSRVQDFQTIRSSVKNHHVIRTEIRITRIKMDQLMKFLYLAELPGHGMRIDQISITRTPAETEYLNAAVTLKTYGKKPSGPERPAA